MSTIPGGNRLGSPITFGGFPGAPENIEHVENEEKSQTNSNSIYSEQIKTALAKLFSANQMQYDLGSNGNTPEIPSGSVSSNSESLETHIKHEVEDIDVCRVDEGGHYKAGVTLLNIILGFCYKNHFGSIF